MSEAPSSPFHLGNVRTADAERLATVLDRQAEVAGVRRLRAWAHAALAARPGERALDIGSGTGSETRVLAAATGDAVGVEPNPGLRAVAEQRAANEDGARFVAGDALALPVPDASVDVVWCERVFQHLHEPDRAAAEIARVLRPGGRVALLDSDWGTSILHPVDPEVGAAISRTARTMAANPLSGRQLTGQLTAAGLVVTDIGSQALIQDHREVNKLLVQMIGERAVAAGELTEAQRDRLYADLDAAAARGALHMSVTMFGVIARHP